MPLLVAKWPGVVGNLARTAIHCQQAKSNLEELAMLDCQELAISTNVLSIEPLKNLSLERISNILRVWLKQNHIQQPSTKTFQRLIDEVIFSKLDAMPEVSWDDFLVRRYHNKLYLERKNASLLPICSEWTSFPAPIVLPN
jgi:tRNA(Ile)-lysidine synthase